MRKNYDKFVRSSLNEMNFPVDAIENSTALGQGGLDIDSLAASELAMRVTDTYGVTLPPEDIIGLPDLNYCGLLDLLVARIGAEA